MSTDLKFQSRDDLHKFIFKNWMEAVQNGDIQKAFDLDAIHYIKLVKENEDINYWNRWQFETFKIRNDLVRQFEKEIPSSLTKNYASNCFLIVYYNYSGLAHETILARNIAYLRKSGVNINVEIVYLFGPKNTNAHKNASNLYGVTLNSIHFLESSNIFDAGKRLYQLAFGRNIQGIIYPSIFYMAFWISLLVPHGNQKFIQMKYYPFHSGRIRHWYGGLRNSGEKFVINGFEYLQLPMLDIKPAKNIYHKSYKENIDNNNQLTIGSISRAEKISSEKYNNFIYKLLDSQPTLTYLYTGEQSSISLIPERIRSHTRAESLGWVDPFTSISRFTIYLEPFPWGGGEMTFLALEHGLPYLILETKESLEVGIYGQIKCIAQDRDPILQFSFCGSISELNERIDKLVKNPELRFKLGQAWRQTFMDYQPQLMNHWRDLFNE